MTDSKISMESASSPETELLNVFVGKWNTSGEVVASVSTPAASIVATDTYEWLPGGYALIHYVEGAIGDTQVQSLEFIGYDRSREAYFVPFFDDQGGAGWEELRVDGKTWTWHGEHVMGVAFHRCIATVSDDGDAIVARHEQSSDGVHWQPWMNVTLTRVA